MQSLRMNSKLLPDLVEHLKSWGTVWAPVERGHGVYSLEVIDDPHWERVREEYERMLRTVTLRDLKHEASR